MLEKGQRVSGWICTIRSYRFDMSWIMFSGLMKYPQNKRERKGGTPVYAEIL